jgi:hypothetical protein
MATPTQTPCAVQVSECVQAIVSSQSWFVFGVTLQDAVPLQERKLHWSLEHVMREPPVHLAFWQVSPYVQSSPSLHAVLLDFAGCVQAPLKQ